MLSAILATACLAATTIAQTPAGYQPSTPNPLQVFFGNVAVTAGETLDPSIPTSVPTIGVTTPLNASSGYLAILIDPYANRSTANPAKLLWFQQDISFALNSSAPQYFYLGTPTHSPQVPFLAPSVLGEEYILYLYPQPPGFTIPSNFPYNATFRGGFNVTRVAVDFQVPGPLAGNYFFLGNGGNASASGVAAASGTGSTSGPTIVPFTGGAVAKAVTVIPAALVAVFCAMIVL